MSASRKRPGGAPSEAQSTMTEPHDGDSGDPEYDELIEAVVQATKDEMLYVPPKPESEPPELPEDWSTIGAVELMTLHGAFAAYALRAGFLEKIEEAKAMICKQAGDELFDILFGEMTVTKDSSVTHAKSQVESDPNLKRWRRRENKHRAFSLSHKMDREGYQKITDALSRLHTMRKDEWEMAGSKSGGNGFSRKRPGSG